MSDGLNQRFFHIGDASIRFVTPLDESGLEMLESVGFPQDVVPKTQMKHVELLCHNRICHGVGIKNKHGGMEFFSSDQAQSASPSRKLSVVNGVACLSTCSTIWLIRHCC